MAKLLGTYDNLAQAEAALAHLRAGGIEAQRLSVISAATPSAAKMAWKKPLLLGAAAGAGALFLLPGGGHLLLAGHLVRAAAIHKLALTAKAAASGMAAGGTVAWLKRLGLKRLALKEVEDALAAGRCALILQGDWRTQQRAARLLAATQNPAATKPANQRLLDLVQRYGWEHQSFLSLYDGMQVWWTSDPEAAVVYRQVGHVAIVVAAPLAPHADWHSVTARFLAWCEQNKLDCLMLPLGAEYAAVARACGMALLCVGESGYFKLPEWKPAGDRAKKVRAGVNQARKAGVRIEQYVPAQSDESTRTEIEELCQAWINTREVDALGWLLELDPFKLSEHKRYFLAREADGRLTGLLACSPIFARRGWYLEDLIRHPAATRGISELLVVEALRHLAAEGAQLATLATSPLAGIKPNELTGQFKQLARLLKLIYEHFDAFYHFKALHRFKAKFAPSYVEPDYVALYPPRVQLRMISSAMGVFDPAGFSGVIASKLHKVWQRLHKAQPDSEPVSALKSERLS
ncbi:MAG: DUF2156 domain-containing protein [Acidobacteria bacterium]|nr:DUF2156 domain-containing protein [Acidobacteriota bacterium]MBI3426150.1 DUF2156 domain-containing protein [Acidobacteriota bacterium]